MPGTDAPLESTAPPAEATPGIERTLANIRSMLASLLGVVLAEGRITPEELAVELCDANLFRQIRANAAAIRLDLAYHEQQAKEWAAMSSEFIESLPAVQESTEPVRMDPTNGIPLVRTGPGGDFSHEWPGAGVADQGG